MGWVDLHSHVLPGIDDGAATWEDSIAMCEIALHSGTSVLAATPHIRVDYPDVHAPELAGLVAELNDKLSERGLDIEVVVGAEVALVDALDRRAEELELVSLGGGGTLLVESPHGPLPPLFESQIAGVVERGHRVLLAHPEHNPDFQADPERLRELVEGGILLQVTAGSFAARGRPPFKRAAVEFLRNGWVHVIASDAHAPGWRPPVISEGVDAAMCALPEATDEITWAATAAPRAVLAGEALPPRPERGEPKAQRRWLRR